MRQINNISDDAIQLITIPQEEGDIFLTLRFSPVTEMWFMNIEYNEKIINGVKCSIGVLHCRSKNYPFDFVLEDVSGASLDPFALNDFSSGRINLYLVEAEEMADIRGQAVQ